jgi:hypothetical protein
MLKNNNVNVIYRMSMLDLALSKLAGKFFEPITNKLMSKATDFISNNMDVLKQIKFKGGAKKKKKVVKKRKPKTKATKTKRRK